MSQRTLTGARRLPRTRARHVPARSGCAGASSARSPHRPMIDNADTAASPLAGPSRGPASKSAPSPAPATPWSRKPTATAPATSVQSPLPHGLRGPARVANDDGSFTLVDTQTRLVRGRARADRARRGGTTLATRLLSHAPSPWSSKQQAAPLGRVKAAARRRSSSASSDHWKRLLRRPPREPVALDAQAFVDELNRRLRADPAWREDTRFVVARGDGAPTRRRGKGRSR